LWSEDEDQGPGFIGKKKSTWFTRRPRRLGAD